MATKREKSIKNIIDMFTRFSQKVLLHNAVNFYDINISSEPLFMGVLNRVYDLQLKNMNSIQKNFPAIDLGDDGASICYQITSTGTNEKYSDTVKKFKEKKLGAKYKELRFLIVGESKITKKDTEIRTKIFTLKDLVSDVGDMPDSDLFEFETYLSIQMDERKNSGSILPVAILAPNNSDSIEKFLDYHEIDELDKPLAREDMKNFLSQLRSLTKKQREFIFHITDKGHFPNSSNRYKGDTDRVFMTRATLESSFEESIGNLQTLYRILKSLEDIGIAHWHDDYTRYLGDYETNAVSLRYWKKFEDFNIISALKDFANGDREILYEVFVNTSTIDLA